MKPLRNIRISVLFLSVVLCILSLVSFASAIQFAENFDVSAKAAYAAADVTIHGNTWNLDDVLTGNIAGDKKNGTYSLRMRAPAAGQGVTMKFDYPYGASTVLVSSATYGSDAASSWSFWKSTDQGGTWTQVGSAVTTTGTLTATTFTVNVSGNIRFQIRRASGSSSTRINFDDFTINGYGTPTIAVTQGSSIANGGSKSFGSVNLGSYTDLTFTINNTGNGASALSFNDLTGTDFSFQGTNPAVVTASGSATFTVRFTPTAVGSRTATVNVTNDQTGNTPYVINLSGTGVGVPNLMANIGIDVPNGGTINYGECLIGTAYDYPITINNSGTGASALSFSDLSGEFTYLNANPATVAAGSSAIFTVRFIPTAVGLRSGSVSITTDQVGNTPYVINLQGTGTGSPSLSVAVVSTPVANDGTQDFGTVTLGSYSDITFNIQNVGTLPSSLSFNSLSGDFSYQGSNPSSIAANSGLEYFTVRFTPTAIGARTATINITNDQSGNSPFVIHLTGTGGSYATPPIANPDPNPAPQTPWTPTIPTDPTIGDVPTAPVVIDFPAQAGPYSNPTSITVTQTTTPPASLLGSGLVDANHTIARFWTITPNSENFVNATLTLHFGLADLPAGIVDPITAVPRLYALYSSNGVNWHIMDGVITGPDANGVYSYTVSGLNHFSEWGVGNGALLPVQLATFNITSFDKGIRLNWTTESELNVKRFKIERWANGDENNVQTILHESKSVNGNSSTTLNYSVEDKFAAVQGQYYHYRLSEETLDGTVTELRSRVVEYRVKTFELPKGFGLLKAYPNPFNPTTTIRVQLRETATATVSIYNTNGQLVSTLYRGLVGIEPMNLQFNAANLPSGVYMVQISSPKFTTQKKIVLMK